MTDQESDEKECYGMKIVDLTDEEIAIKEEWARYSRNSIAQEMARLIARNEKLKADNARLREALADIVILDQAKYDCGTWAVLIARKALKQPSADAQKEQG